MPSTATDFLAALKHALTGEPDGQVHIPPDKRKAIGEASAAFLEAQIREASDDPGADVNPLCKGCAMIAVERLVIELAKRLDEFPPDFMNALAYGLDREAARMRKKGKDIDGEAY